MKILVKLAYRLIKLQILVLTIQSSKSSYFEMKTLHYDFIVNAFKNFSQRVQSWYCSSITQLFSYTIDFSNEFFKVKVSSKHQL